MGPEDREVKEPLINHEQNYEPAHQEDAADEAAGWYMLFSWSRCVSVEETPWNLFSEHFGVSGPGDLEAPPEDSENKGNGVGVTVLMTTFIMLGESSWRAL